MTLISTALAHTTGQARCTSSQSTQQRLTGRLRDHSVRECADAQRDGSLLSGGQRLWLVGRGKPLKSISRPSSALGHFVLWKRPGWRCDWVQTEGTGGMAERKSVNSAGCGREDGCSIAREEILRKQICLHLCWGLWLQCDRNMLYGGHLAGEREGPRLGACLEGAPLLYTHVTCRQSARPPKTPASHA